MTAVTAVPIRPVRGWLRRVRSAHRDGSVLGDVYVALLLVVIVGGIFRPSIGAVCWPAAPAGGLLTAVGVPLAVLGALLLGLRRLGPLSVSRPAAHWLLTAPISRRALLTPAFGAVTAAGALIGALAMFVGIGQTVGRPVPVRAALVVVLGGAALAVAAVVAAVIAQRRPSWARATDAAAYAVLALGSTGFTLDRSGLRRAVPITLTDPLIEYAVAALAVTVLLATAVTWIRLDRTPDAAVLAASSVAGTAFDAAYGIQPSFLTDLIERRSWTGRRLRSRRLWTRVPVPLALDLLVLGRKGRRLAWVAGALLLPVVLAGGPQRIGWPATVALLLGAMSAATTSTSSIRTDARNPALLRLQAVSGRRAVAYRAALPVALASAWSASAFALLTAVDALPPGPWWALGLALGPAAAAAAIRRSRLGLVQNGLLPLDTPMGSIETGPALGAITGYDLLLVLSLPSIMLLHAGAPLPWSSVLTQAVLATLGLLFYVRGSTAEKK